MLTNYHIQDQFTKIKGSSYQGKLVVNDDSRHLKFELFIYSIRLSLYLLNILESLKVGKIVHNPLGLFYLIFFFIKCETNYYFKILEPFCNGGPLAQSWPDAKEL